MKIWIPKILAIFVGVFFLPPNLHLHFRLISALSPGVLLQQLSGHPLLQPGTKKDWNFIPPRGMLESPSHHWMKGFFRNQVLWRLPWTSSGLKLSPHKLKTTKPAGDELLIFVKSWNFSKTNFGCYLWAQQRCPDVAFPISKVRRDEHNQIFRHCTDNNWSFLQSLDFWIQVMLTIFSRVDKSCSRYNQIMY